MRIAVIASETIVISPHGTGLRLPPGRYTIADIDGTAERGELFIEQPGSGDLLQVNPHDVNITIEKTGFDRLDQVHVDGFGSVVHTILQVDNNAQKALVTDRPGSGHSTWVPFSDVRLAAVS